MSFGFLSNLGKIAATATIGAGIASPVVIYDQQSWNPVPLTSEKLDEFKKSKGFESCYKFLEEKDKLSLLFVCLKKVDNLGEDKTHVTQHFFYDSGVWREAIGLRKDPNSENILLVETKGWWSNREIGIKNTEEQKTKLQQVGNNKKCQFNSVQVKGSQKGNRVFVCFNEEPKLKWTLQEFTGN